MERGVVRLDRRGPAPGEAGERPCGAAPLGEPAARLWAALEKVPAAAPGPVAEGDGGTRGRGLAGEAPPCGRGIGGMGSGSGSGLLPS